MAGTYVYIDGLNLYYGAVASWPALKWLDIEALVRQMLPDDEIGRIRYFNASVVRRWVGDRGRERQNAYFRALRSNPLIDVVEGWFQVNEQTRPLANGRELSSPDMVRVVTHEEKSTDVSLGAHLVWDALKRHCAGAVIVSNDADFVDAIRLARSEGLDVAIVNPTQLTTTARLLSSVDGAEVPFPHDALPQCQLPAAVRGRNGKMIDRPREWS